MSKFEDVMSITKSNTAQNSNGDRTPQKPVLQQLERILISPEFRASDRRKKFLRYVVEETLAERADRLKGFSIAVSVLDRDETFDPQTDPVVRLEARRLRRDLEHYYLTAGSDDPILISIPKGAYVPKFTQNEELEPGSPTAEQSSAENHMVHIDVAMPRSIIRFVVVFGIAALVLAVWFFVPFRTPAPSITGKPFVAVLPLKGTGDTEYATTLASGYIEAVVSNLTKLSGLSVMATRSSRSVEIEPTSLRKLRDNQGVTHVLKGTFMAQSESVRINVQLIDTGTEEVVWAEQFDGEMSDLFELEDKLANRIATVLSVTIDADESRRIYLRYTSSREAIKLMRYATVIINPPAQRARVQTARRLHQRIIDLDPDFPGGYAGMAQVHLYMVLLEHSKRPEEDLKNAIEFARKAIEMDDSFSMGHAMLGLAYALSGKNDLALSQMRHAVELEPGDPASLQWYSGVLIFAGHYQEAITTMQEALRLDPIEHRTAYLNIMGMAYFNLEQYDRAIEVYERNLRRGGPDNANKELFRAASYAALGRETKAREVIAKINMNPSNVPPENWIFRWTRSRKLAGKTIATLRRLGLKADH